MSKERKRILIMGALGMDFHVYLRVFRDNEEYEVVAFTIAGEQNVGTTSGGERKFPPELAGDLYPDGIPMLPEDDLVDIIKEKDIDQVILAYSDVSHEEVMHRASLALAAGADFRLISGKKTMIKANKPVVSICAVRTGCGKSQVSRATYRYLKSKGYKVVAIREPMPYGDLIQQEVMRFETYEDLDKYECTIEEREEYEPYIEQGLVIYSGVDYEKIVREAEKEADVLVFDGGNNEISFYEPDLQFVVVDPLRPGHEKRYHPGEVNAHYADAFVINKMNSAKEKDVKTVEKNLNELNPVAVKIYTDSVVTVEDSAKIKGKKVIVVEDGPTLTHGEMSIGAAYVASQKHGAQIVDPKPYLTGRLKEVFEDFPQITEVVPAMGYSDRQIEDLQETLNKAECEIIVNGSPINIENLLDLNKPVIRVTYDIETHKGRSIEDVLNEFEAKFLKN
ncbi:MAG: Cyclic 2,3-diphosphoglycerate synthetase [Promethearchaeota archaeon]|nr:MAG: Cyclic 2,3-diphosphoglycerate synthetase [Candidatus Lokiarchaeota archaeon]